MLQAIRPFLARVVCLAGPLKSLLKARRIFWEEP
jgi:hypothetical protein